MDMKEAMIGFADDQIIYHEDTVSDAMYLLLKGKVGRYKNHAKGEIMVEEFEEGQIIGAIDFLAETKRRDKMVALRNVRAIKIDKSNLDCFISDSPSSVMSLLANLSAGLREADDKFVRMNAKHVDYSYNQKVELPDILKGRAFPVGHYSYPQSIDDSHVEYLLNKNVMCPICEKEFNVFQTRNSRLQIKETKEDFRKIYKNFDTIWYEIWTCPHCKYSNLHYDFFKLNPNEKAEIRDICLVVGNSFNEKIGIKTNYNQVFESYYLTLACMEGMKANSFNKGKIWLNIAWLYQDCGQEKLYKMAYKQACAMYSDGWFTSTVRLSETDEQKLCLMLGEMYLDQGDYKNSKNYFLKAINNKKGKKIYNDKARGRIQDVKDMEKGII